MGCMKKRKEEKGIEGFHEIRGESMQLEVANDYE